MNFIFSLESIENTFGFISRWIILLLCKVSIVVSVSKIILQAFPNEKDLLWDKNNCSKEISMGDVIIKLYSNSYPNFINSGIILQWY